MALTEPVDIYCERISAAFWAEPLNALSNVAFVIAALVAWRTARRLHVSTPELPILLILAGLIGIGSFLFHTFANGWSELTDVIPIWSFVAVYVLASVANMRGRPISMMTALGAAAAVVLVIIFLARGEGAPAGVTAAPDPLNGSGQYAPALIALVIFSFLGWRRKAQFPRGFWPQRCALSAHLPCAPLIWRSVHLGPLAPILRGTF